MLLIAFGVILFAAVTHLQDLWMGFMGLMGLFSPILLAGAFALILNVPVRGFERIFARLDRRNHLKPGTRNMLGLTLTLLLLPLVLAVVGRFILPQFFSAINAVVALIRDNPDQIERFAMELGLDPEDCFPEAVGGIPVDFPKPGQSGRHGGNHHRQCVRVRWPAL